MRTIIFITFAVLLSSASASKVIPTKAILGGNIDLGQLKECLVDKESVRLTEIIDALKSLKDCAERETEEEKLVCVKDIVKDIDEYVSEGAEEIRECLCSIGLACTSSATTFVELMDMNEPLPEIFLGKNLNEIKKCLELASVGQTKNKTRNVDHCSCSCSCK